MVRNHLLNKSVRVKAKPKTLLEHGEMPDICTQMGNVLTTGSLSVSNCAVISAFTFEIAEKSVRKEDGFTWAKFSYSASTV